jgi:hypothetical protein
MLAQPLRALLTGERNQARTSFAVSFHQDHLGKRTLISDVPTVTCANELFNASRLCPGTLCERM